MTECNLRDILKSEPAEASAPCRIDMGGTLDISTFYYPLNHLNPCTFNIAIALRTRVRLVPYNKGRVKVVSKGFESAVYPLDEAPFDHPLGLMFAIASYFRADGIQIEIESASPPRSALGGSSSAAVALIAAISKALEKTGRTRLSIQDTAMLAFMIEGSVAGVPCGLQDQLAAGYGGVNAWYWKPDITGPPFERKQIAEKESFRELERRILLAYCGIPHESKNINSKWVRQFVSGQDRKEWAEIIECTRTFADALAQKDFETGVRAMNRETAIRREMTPDVLDDMGEQLVKTAVKTACSARFTGAGGGGCIWALGETENIDRLREIWKELLRQRKDACLLDVKIDSEGVRSEEREVRSEK